MILSVTLHTHHAYSSCTRWGLAHYSSLSQFILSPLLETEFSGIALWEYREEDTTETKFTFSVSIQHFYHVITGIH